MNTSSSFAKCYVHQPAPAYSECQPARHCYNGFNYGRNTGKRRRRPTYQVYIGSSARTTNAEV